MERIFAPSHGQQADVRTSPASVYRGETVFQPLEYRSTNCCICIYIYPRSISLRYDEGGLVCYCLPNPSPSPPSVSIVTPSKTWYIDKDLNMPDITFTAQLSNVDGPVDADILWVLTMTFRKERRSYTHTLIAGGDWRDWYQWSPDWRTLLAGANDMTVEVFVDLTYKVLWAARSGYEIHGENPTKEQIFGLATKIEYKAVCWQESWHKQFAESYSDTPYVGVELPLYGPPDGWGLMHEDPLPSERHLWDWRRNLSKGIQHLQNTSYTEAQNYLEHWYGETKDDPETRWGWNPEENTDEVWNDAFSRYNTGAGFFSPNGNGGVPDCDYSEDSQRGCAYSTAVRGHIDSEPWDSY